MQQKIKAYLKQRLTTEQRAIVRKKAANLLAPFVRRNLTILANLYGTDKTNGHWYTPHYMSHFRKFRNKKVKLLEIGVGGYEDPYAGGASLRMWKKYFLFGKIFSIDIYDKSPHEENRIKIYRGSQVDGEFLKKLDNFSLFLPCSSSLAPKYLPGCSQVAISNRGLTGEIERSNWGVTWVHKW